MVVMGLTCQIRGMFDRNASILERTDVELFASN